MDEPTTMYARTAEGLSIAYQVVGTGPRDIVFMPYAACIDLMWEDPDLSRFLKRLSTLGRLILLDARGQGGSDPVSFGAVPTPEMWIEDLRAVLDEVSSQTTSVVVHGSASFLGMMFAATYPERTEALVLIESFACAVRSEDYPWGAPPEALASFADFLEETWGTDRSVSYQAPSRAGDPAFAKWLGRYERGVGSRKALRALWAWNVQLDMRPVLPAIRVPTLVIHHEKNRVCTVLAGRFVAENIAGARFIGLPGEDNLFYTEGADEMLDHIEEFVTGAPPVREPDRALATVLFTDIVSSTEHVSRLGDKRWTELLDRHDALIARELDRHRGHRVNPTGDGILATFDGPARAVRCAQAICSSARDLGIEVRAGLHTGEVELRDGDIGGIAVHIGQRVSALAGPGEVLVSRTVTDLVAGSGLEFEERGERELKGVPGRWSIFAVLP